MPQYGGLWGVRNMSCTIRDSGWEGADATVLAKLTLHGADIQQADIATIQRKIFDLDGDDPNTALSTRTIPVASTVFDTLQTNMMTLDGTGYNFKQTMAGSVFTEANHRYRIEYKFTSVAGLVFYLVYELTTRNLMSV